MSNYTPITNFSAKDGLASGNPAKLIKGSDFTNEFTAIQTAIASKTDGTLVGFPDTNGGGGPGVYFTNNSTTGVANSSGVLQLQTAGVTRFSITTGGATTITSGNGTGSAGALFVQGGATSGDRGLTVQGGVASTDYAAIFREGAGTTNLVTIQPQGVAITVTLAAAAHSVFPVTIQGKGAAGSNNGLLVLAGLNASDLVFSANNSTNTTAYFQVGGDGQIYFGAVATTTTAPGAGGAGALPATPAGYMTLNVAGTNRKVPYY